MSEALILLDGWKPPVLAQFAIERQSELKAALALYNKPIENQEQANDVAALIGEAERFETDIEDASAAVRKAYFDHGKLVKATTDAFWGEVYKARAPVQGHLANWETEQKVKPLLNMQIQAQKEAEATGQPVKPVTWEPPKTEGVNVSTELEYEVVDERAFAEWCWANGRSHWVRRIEFAKAPITEELAKVPDTAPVPTVPGLTIRRVASVRVKKAKQQRPVNVSAVKVGL